MEWENMSYNDPAVEQRAASLCGPSFGLWAAMRTGGVGSPPLTLLNASHGLMAPFGRAEDLRRANLEMRPSGFILRCRSWLETLALLLPFANVREVVLTAHGPGSEGTLSIVTHDGVSLDLEVPRGQMGTMSKLLGRNLPSDLLHLPTAAR